MPMTWRCKNQEGGGSQRHRGAEQKCAMKMNHELHCGSFLSFPLFSLPVRWLLTQAVVATDTSKIVFPTSQHAPSPIFSWMAFQQCEGRWDLMTAPGIQQWLYGFNDDYMGSTTAMGWRTVIEVPQQGYWQRVWEWGGWPLLALTCGLIWEGGTQREPWKLEPWPVHDGDEPRPSSWFKFVFPFLQLRYNKMSLPWLL